MSTAHGHLLTMADRHVERFYDRIAICEHGITCEICCWEWQGARGDNGYGRMRVTNGVAGAHKLAYALQYGVVLGPGDQVLHSCDNPPCCQGHHLSLGSQSENMQEMWDRGRHPGAWPETRRLAHIENGSTP